MTSSLSQNSLSIESSVMSNIIPVKSELKLQALNSKNS